MGLRETGHALWSMTPRALREPLQLLGAAAQRWNDADGAPLGASIAFYTMFALAPLLLVTIAVAGTVFGEQAARGQVVAQIEGVVGPAAARAIEAMLEAAWRDPASLKATVLGVVTLFVGATGVFAQLRRALNAIGRIEPSPQVISTFVRVRLRAFALLLGFGFLAIASLLLSAVLSAATSFVSQRVASLATTAMVLDFVVSVSVLSVAFAALLHWLPDASPSPRAVWISALTSALLFAVGKQLIGFYLGRASIASSYGAAGSFVVVMLWVYYSAQIFLFGAAVGRVYDERRDALQGETASMSAAREVIARASRNAARPPIAGSGRKGPRR